MKEIWKPIPSFKSYEASTLGRIRNLKGVVLKQEISNRKYLRVGLTEDGVQTKMSVHRIILTVFKREPEKNEVCNHLNCDTLDNRIENLEWITQSENQRYARRLGRQISMPPHVPGEKCGHAKLTEKEALEILNSNESLTALSKKYNISRSSVLDIRARRTWKHLPYE